ncbi:hypothetical protein FJV03_09730 [Acinetobacter baumannii]|uniref:hypothetical protein n=1 Tax=Acinetobacter baumannii TaxID=470 RepID=UPI00112A93F0|nr:hypothetical protein [Acinetobacter baumannii]TPS30756.1 hypothetical protein FJV03_09730 [Acinetobacter baumannii]
MANKLLIPTLISSLMLIACSKEHTADLQKQMKEARAKSEKIQAREIQQQSTESTQQETQIPISDSSDKGTYFLISKEQKGKNFIIVYKRAGVEQTVFSKYEINCNTRKMRTLGEGIDSLDNLQDYPQKGTWFTPIISASTGDTFNFICGNNTKTIDKKVSQESTNNLSSNIEKDAIIGDRVTDDVIRALVQLVQINGYKCDTVSGAIPFTMSTGYTLYCNNHRYTYEIEDKGGNIIVTVK